MPASAWPSKKLHNWYSESCCNIVSVFNQRIYLPLLTDIAWFVAFVKPTLLLFSMIQTSGKCLLTCSTVLSLDALSTNIISTDTGNLLFASDSRHGSRTCQQLRDTMHTDITGNSFVGIFLLANDRLVAVLRWSLSPFLKLRSSVSHIPLIPKLICHSKQHILGFLPWQSRHYSCCE